jgi:hypothetical protein
MMKRDTGASDVYQTGLGVIVADEAVVTGDLKSSRSPVLVVVTSREAFSSPEVSTSRGFQCQPPEDSGVGRNNPTFLESGALPTVLTC